MLDEEPVGENPCKLDLKEIVYATVDRKSLFREVVKVCSRVIEPSGSTKATNSFSRRTLPYGVKLKQ
jgi:hypothetical protein